MEKRARFDFNFVTVGFLYLLSFVFYYGTFSVMDESSRVFPRVISVIAAFLATLLLLRSLNDRRKNSSETFNFDGSMKVINITIMTVAYIFMLGYIGFYIATPIFLVGCFKYLGVTNKKVLIISPIVMDIVVLVFFDILFKIPLPMGSIIEPVLKSLNIM